MTKIDDALEALNKLGQTRKLGEKRKILVENKHNDILKKIFYWVENPRITFGVKRFVFKPTNLTVPTEHHFEQIETLLGMLSRRDLTGANAQTVITNVSSGLSQQTQDLLSKILNKKLGCNVGTSLIFEVWKDLFPRFGCQLAEAVKHVTDLPLPIIVSPKLDGVRNIVGVDNGVIKTWTRSGDINHNTEFIIETLRPFVEHGFTFDGELMAANWNKTSSITRASVNKPDEATIKTLKYYIFDMVPTDEFESGDFTESLSDRLENIWNLLSEEASKPDSNIVIVPHAKLSSHAKVEEYYKQCLQDGYEGIVAKVPSAKYVQDRTKDWLKYKPEETIDATITGFTEGTGSIAEIYLEETDLMTDEIEKLTGHNVARAYKSSLIDVVSNWDNETGGVFNFKARLDKALNSGYTEVELKSGKIVKKYKGAGALVTKLDDNRILECSGINHAIKILIPLFIDDLKGLTLEMVGQEDHSGKESISNFARYKRLRCDK